MELALNLLSGQESLDNFRCIYLYSSAMIEYCSEKYKELDVRITANKQNEAEASSLSSQLSELQRLIDYILEYMETVEEHPSHINNKTAMFREMSDCGEVFDADRFPLTRAFLNDFGRWVNSVMISYKRVRDHYRKIHDTDPKNISELSSKRNSAKLMRVATYGAGIAAVFIGVALPGGVGLVYGVAGVLASMFVSTELSKVEETITITEHLNNFAKNFTQIEEDMDRRRLHPNLTDLKGAFEAIATVLSNAVDFEKDRRKLHKLKTTCENEFRM